MQTATSRIFGVANTQMFFTWCFHNGSDFVDEVSGYLNVKTKQHCFQWKFAMRATFIMKQVAITLPDGTPKGLRMVLQERGVNTAGMKADALSESLQ